jgi:hypothetical protein
MLELDTKRAHVYIPAVSGAGKTTLAKAIIKQNKPDLVKVFSENKKDWESPSSDLKQLKLFFESVVKIKESSKSKEIQDKKFIAVFDDFNNQDGINMWNNKLIQKVFTEGRKYNFHCILIAHNARGSGNQLRSNCHYSVAFKPKSVDELVTLSRENVLGDMQAMKEKFSLLQSKYDFLVMSDGNINPCKSTEKGIVSLEQNFDLYQNLDTSIKNMGNNNTINQSNNIVQSLMLKNSQVFQEQKLAHDLKLKEMEYEAEQEKQALKFKAIQIISKSTITAKEQRELITILNRIRKTPVVITSKNLNYYVGLFAEKFMGYPHQIIVDHTYEPIQSFIAGESVTDLALSTFNNYGGIKFIKDNFY